jgi:hypothetical protein
MSRTSLPLRRSAIAAIGIIALIAACDRESPTDVPQREARVSLAQAPSLAVGGSKPTGPTGYEIITVGTQNDVAGENLFVGEAACPAGKRALGGGFKSTPAALIGQPDIAVYESAPRVTVTGTTDGWRMEIMNRGSTPRHFDVYAICAAI